MNALYKYLAKVSPNRLCTVLGHGVEEPKA